MDKPNYFKRIDDGAIFCLAQDGLYYLLCGAVEFPNHLHNGHSADALSSRTSFSPGYEDVVKMIENLTPATTLIPRPRQESVEYYKKQIENAHRYMDDSEIITSQKQGKQGLTPRIMAIIHKYKKLEKAMSNDEFREVVEKLKVAFYNKGSVNDIAEEHYKWLEKMNWTTGTTPLEQIALIVSEIGEAINECRGEKPTDKLGSELADIILRTLGLSKRLGIDMEKELLSKMEKNKVTGGRGRIK